MAWEAEPPFHHRIC